MIDRETEPGTEVYVAFYDELRVVTLDYSPGMWTYKCSDGGFYDLEELFYTKEEAVEDIKDYIDSEIERLTESRNKLND